MPVAQSGVLAFFASAQSAPPGSAWTTGVMDVSRNNAIAAQTIRLFCIQHPLSVSDENRAGEHFTPHPRPLSTKVERRAIPESGIALTVKIANPCAPVNRSALTITLR